MYKIGAKAVTKMAIIVYVKDEKVGLLAHLDRANLALPADGRGGVNGGRGDGLGRSELQSAAGQRQGKLQVLAPGGAGVQVPADGQQSAGSQDLPGRHVVSLRQSERRGWQGYGHGVAGRQGGDLLRGDVNQMVH